jgi:hypothetical protein
MRHTPARTTQPGGVYRAGFESVLPPKARDELFTHKRPRILSQPSNAPDRRPALILAVLVFLLVAGAAIALWQRQAAYSEPAVPTVPTVILPTPAPTVAPAVQPAASPQPTPLAEPTQPPSAVATWLAAAPIVRRAELVRMPTPTPRAKLVRLPELVRISPEAINPDAHDPNALWRRCSRYAPRISE